MQGLTRRSKMRVMVVEDNSSNLAVICQLVGRLENVQ